MKPKKIGISNPSYNCGLDILLIIERDLSGDNLRLNCTLAFTWVSGSGSNKFGSATDELINRVECKLNWIHQTRSRSALIKQAHECFGRHLPQHYLRWLFRKMWKHCLTQTGKICYAAGFALKRGNLHEILVHHFYELDPIYCSVNIFIRSK